MTMSSDLVARIAVENTAYSFDKPFDYLVPKKLADRCKAGMHVLVPFGRGNKKRQGVVLEVLYSQTDGLKSIICLLDNEPVLSEEMIKTAEFISEHCFCTLYDAIKTMLPAGINYKVTSVYGANEISDDARSLLSDEQRRVYDYLFSKRKPVKSDIILDAFGYSDTEILDKLAADGILYKSDRAYRRVSDAVMKMAAINSGVDISKITLTEKQKRAAELIEMSGGVSVKEILYFTGVSSSVIDSLYKKGLIHLYDEEVFRIEKRAADEKAPEITLSHEQQKACDSLYDEYRDLKPHTSLLYGVTGSGKTSVFIKLIERVIDDNRGIIVMVPEISLTPQFVSQFSQRFGDKIAVGIDANEGMVAAEGWTETSSVNYLELGKRMDAIGVQYIIFTDISRDGTLSGPNFAQLDLLNRAVSCNVIASGGVSSLKDIVTLADLKLYGAICGKAIYSGDLSLRQAIALCQTGKV